MKAARAASLLSAFLALSGCATLTNLAQSPTPSALAAPARFEAMVEAGAPLRVVGLENAGVLTLVARTGRRDGVERWVGPSGAGLYFRDGLLVATRGLGAGLLAADIRQSSALLRQGRAGNAQRFHSYLTGDNQRMTRTYECLITREGVEEVLLGDGQTTRQMIRMQEDCAGLSHRFQNHYWIDQNGGGILRSRQWTGERIGTVSFADVPAGADIQAVLGGIR